MGNLKLGRFASLSAVVSLLLPLSASAQGIGEMGGAYAQSAGLAGGLHAGAKTQSNAVNSLFGAGIGGLGAITGGGSAAPAPDPVAIAQGPDPRMTVNAVGKESNRLFNLAQMKQKAGKLDEAVKYYKLSLAYRAGIWGDRDPAVTRINYILGQIALKRGNFVDAEDKFRKTLTVNLARFGVGSYEMVDNLKNLGDALNGQKKYLEAANYYQQVYTLKQRKLGEGHPQAIAAGLLLANAYACSDNVSDARDILKEMVVQKESDSGSPQMLAVLEAYSNVLHKLNMTSEADAIDARAQTLRAQLQAVKDAAAAAAPVAPAADEKTAPATANGGKPAASVDVKVEKKTSSTEEVKVEKKSTEATDIKEEKKSAVDAKDSKPIAKE